MGDYQKQHARGRVQLPALLLPIPDRCRAQPEALREGTLAQPKCLADGLHVHCFRNMDRKALRDLPTCKGASLPRRCEGCGYLRSTLNCTPIR